MLVFLDSTLIHRTYGQEVEAEKVEALRDAVDEALRSGKTEAVATVDEEPQ